MIEVGGNSFANAIYEACLPKGFVKPNPESPHEERMNFIRSKYVLQEFLKSGLRISSAGSSLCSSHSGKILNSSHGTSNKTAFPKDVPMRWEKIAAAVPGKSKARCMKRVAELKRDFRSSKATDAT